MVPSVPVTPEPAVTGPATAGQKVRHEPSHLDVVGVSMANQYRTSPLESVSTCWPPTVVWDTVLPPAAVDEAGADAAALVLAEAAGVLVAPPELLPELEQADTVSARAARPAAPHIVRMSGGSPSPCTCSPARDHVRMAVSVQVVVENGGALPAENTGRSGRWFSFQTNQPGSRVRRGRELVPAGVRRAACPGAWAEGGPAWPTCLFIDT